MNFMFVIYFYISFLSYDITAFKQTANEIDKIHHKNSTILDWMQKGSEEITLEKFPVLTEIITSNDIKETVKKFYLFTGGYRDGKEYENIDPHNITSIKNSHFSSLKTYFVIHGFLGNGLEEWILELKEKLLYREDCNVVSVEWPAGSAWFLPTYSTAARRVPSVGNDTAFLLQVLIDHKGLLLSNLHMIGHSLGAHICGFAGKQFQGRVAKITGLDPAGPDFRHLDKRKRLDKSDAIYVDVIHTNACTSILFMDCYGITEDIGHSNFWPNGGKHQPYCSSFFGEIGCNHELAYTYFSESLSYGALTTYFLARKCNSWKEFQDKNCSCGVNPQFMGINSNPQSVGKFFLETKSTPPFAKRDDQCFFNGINWMLIAFFCIVAVITVIISIGIYYSYTHMNTIYSHVISPACNSIPNERTSLLS